MCAKGQILPLASTGGLNIRNILRRHKKDLHGGARANSRGCAWLMGA